jgi:hypothetical protein
MYLKFLATNVLLVLNAMTEAASLRGSALGLRAEFENKNRRADSFSPEVSEVVAMVKIQNAGKQFIYGLDSVWNSDGAYCATDSGSAGQNCKSDLEPGDVQTIDFGNTWDSMTITYAINGDYYNVKASPQGSGLLDGSGKIVSS